jgi:HEAT repeat protein
MGKGTSNQDFTTAERTLRSFRDTDRLSVSDEAWSGMLTLRARRAAAASTPSSSAPGVANPPPRDPVSLDYTTAADLTEQRRWVSRLSFGSDPRKYDYMIKALSDFDPGTRQAALVAMGHSLQSRKVVDRLIKALGDADPLIRAAAAHALAPMRDDAAVRAKLNETIRYDDDPTVVATAQKALRPD